MIEGRYDYSKTKWVDSQTPVTITCPIHGDFKQLPNGHLLGHGCQKCSGKYMDTEYFIEQSKKIHGNRYDYSKTEYIDNRTKVIIICKIHGEFKQRYDGHLSGYGCPKCSGGYMDTEYFIEKAKEIHRDKYDYSKAEYVNFKTPVIIICPEHGEFKQRPGNHFRGSNCPKCARNKTTQEFIEQSNKIHNNKYDYSKTKYVDSRIEVIIICPEHGEFKQKPRNHLPGHGCPKCAGKNQTTKEFIKKAKKIHGNRYDYSKTEYINISTKVVIICKKHGEFEQLPPIHLEGYGCSKCSGRYMDTEYFIEKAKKIHKDKYDYSKTKYIKATSKLIITCKKHGDFKQRPGSHLEGRGCSKCGYKKIWETRRSNV
jgi:ribosomal protein L36